MLDLSSAPFLALTADGGCLDWPVLERELPVLGSLAECPQEPVYHGEGDVLAHTKLVCEQLIADGRWLALADGPRQELLLAALLHDIGKPSTAREENGRLVSPGHASRGSVIARRLLWEAGLEPQTRERICALVAFHMVPYFLTSNDPLAARARALEISLRPGCAPLQLLASADARGRLSATNAELELNVELYAAYCEELGILEQPYPFASDHARFLFFGKPERDPAYAAYDDTRCTMTLLSGLPGAGKNTWLEHNAPELPVVALDDLRAETKTSATANQGQVVQLAKERAREHLRAGRDFAWNATSLSRRQRAQAVGLAADYNARVRIVSVEIGAGRQAEQNASRGHKRAVPQAAIERMLAAWEAPSLVECHELLVVGS